jgi:hypothetical protein
VARNREGHFTPTLDDILAHLERVKQTGSDQWQALCPAHDDKNPSLSIRIGDNGHPLLYCHAGCGYDRIIAAMGMDRPDTHQPASTKRKIVATYDYRDEHGTLLYQKVRYQPKAFKQRCPDGNGGWTWKLAGVQRVLYRLPELRIAVEQGQIIFFPEGEKDADRLVSLELSASTNCEGASKDTQRQKWLPEYNQQLTGARRLVLLPDADDQGKARVEHIAQQLAGIIPDIRIVPMPAPFKDVSDWLNAGHTRDELLALVDSIPSYKLRGNGYDTEPPERELPPVDAYADDLSTQHNDLPKDWNRLPSIEKLRISEDELLSAVLHPRCIVKEYLYADVALLVAPGGTGKTTLILYEMIHIILGLPLYGLEVESPGPCMLITAEDSRETAIARTREIMEALELTPDKKRQVARDLLIWDVTGESARLAETNEKGNVVLTPLVDQIAAAPIKELAMITFDPAINFGVGERFVNDNEHSLILAAKHIVRRTGACVRYVHHTGKDAARNQVMDQYAARGGSALSDGARMVAVLQPVKDGNEKLTPPANLTVDFATDSALTLTRAKLSYSRPQPMIWIKRTGFKYESAREQPHPTREQVRAACADQVYQFLVSQLGINPPRYHTRHTLEGEGLMSRAEMRRAITDLFHERRIVESSLPNDQQQGGRKTYLNPSPTSPRDFGEVEKKEPFFEAPVSNLAEPVNLAAAYKENIGGEVDTSTSPPIISSFLTTSPRSFGEVRRGGEVHFCCGNYQGQKQPETAPAEVPPEPKKPQLHASSAPDKLAPVKVPPKPQVARLQVSSAPVAQQVATLRVPDPPPTRPTGPMDVDAGTMLSWLRGKGVTGWEDLRLLAPSLRWTVQRTQAAATELERHKLAELSRNSIRLTKEALL